MESRTGSKIRILARQKTQEKLHELEKKIVKCDKCDLSLRTPGFGDCLSRIVLVGQSLHGYCPETPQKQIPFIGPQKIDSGDTLFAGIEKAGLLPEQLWITNIIKCHPPQNRPNASPEEENCWPIFIEEMFTLKPSFIIALGNQSFDTINRYAYSRKKVVGKIYLRISITNNWNKLETKLYRVKHPSWAMRSGKNTETEWINEFANLLKSLIKTLAKKGFKHGTH